MQDFRALSSSQETNAVDVMEEQYMGDISEIPVTPQSQQVQQGQILPLQIILFGSPSGPYVGVPTSGAPTTGQLASISNASLTTSISPSLIAALQATMSP